MAAYNGTRRKATDGLVLYTNENYYKSFPGEPTTNLFPTAETPDGDQTQFNTRVGGAGHRFYRVYRDKDTSADDIRHKGGGMYNSYVPGSMSNSDVVYKYVFPNSSNNNRYSKHGFSGIALDIGKTYIFSAEVFVSKNHVRNVGSKWPVLSATPVDQPTSYAYYNFSKKGTWQVVTMLITPSILKPAVSTSGTSGSSGSGGSAGTSGIVKKSIKYGLYIWPTATCTLHEYSNGFIIYKNVQLEENTHRTQFIKGSKKDVSASNSRVASKGLKDLSGNGNSLNLSKIPFDENAKPKLGSFGSYGAYFDVGLTKGVSSSSSFSVGSSNKKTYDFWVKLDLSDSRQSSLFYGDISRSGNFLSGGSLSKRQHVYVLNNRVYCEVYNTNGSSTSFFTKEKVLSSNTIHHIVVSVDMTLSYSKIRIFIGGSEVSCSSIKNLLPPSSVTVKAFPFNNPAGVSRFRTGSKINYRISSVNENGESIASNVVNVVANNKNIAMRLAWKNVKEASKFFIYRSIDDLGEFGSQSLISEEANSAIGGKGNETLSFLDDGSGVPTLGTPKASALSKYTSKSNTFYDGSDMQLAVGSYPRADASGKKIYSLGNIYKLSIYKKAFDPKQALSSYIQGLEDFSQTNNTATSSFSSSAGSSVGGYGGY